MQHMGFYSLLPYPALFFRLFSQHCSFFLDIDIQYDLHGYLL